MGSSLSLQHRQCSCDVQETALSFEIYEAARTGLPGAIIKYLKEKGNVNAKYKGETMLHAACANGRESVLTILLNVRSLCLNVRNLYNETALMLAAGNGYRDCVEIILVHTHKCPLEIHCQNNNKLSAIDIAHINNRQDVAFCMMSFLKNRPPPTATKPGTPKGGKPTPAPAATETNTPTTRTTTTATTATATATTTATTAATPTTTTAKE